jgi:hypothetical protein
MNTILNSANNPQLTSCSTMVMAEARRVEVMTTRVLAIR